MKKSILIFALNFWVLSVSLPFFSGIDCLKGSGLSSSVEFELSSEPPTLGFVLVDTVGGVGTSPGSVEPARILRDVDTNSELDIYLASTSNQFAATGRFRTEKIDDYWYLISPLGHPFFSVAPNSVQASYPNVTLPADLIEAGFNSLGNWSSHEAINGNSGADIPYVTRLNFLQGYKNTSTRLKNLYNLGVIGVFDPEFITYSNNLAKELIPLANDPYCIGIFSDNELPNYDNTTYGNLLDRFLEVNESDPNYIAANEWMIARKGANYTINATDREEFHGYLMGTYYRIVREAIDKVVPDLLYLGSRLHGGAKSKPSLFREAGKYLDVISINYYGSYEPTTSEIEMWLEESGKPFLISEYYAKGYDVGMENASGAGYKVPTQTDRAIYFENFTIKMLESKGCVGVQWHRMQDDIDPYVNKGFINENGVWYEPLKSSLKNITKDIYGLRDFLKVLPEGKMAGLYDLTNYQGSSLLLSEGFFLNNELSSLGLPGEQISSVLLKSGYKAVLFKGDNYSGDSLEIYESVGDLAKLGFDNCIASLKIALDYRIIVQNPLGKLITYKSKDRSIDLSNVFLLNGHEEQILPVEISSIEDNGLFTAEISGSSLNISFLQAENGEGKIVIKSEFDNLIAYDTLFVNILEIPWNAPVKDSYIRGGKYSLDNYGQETEMLIKYSDNEEFQRISFLGFELKPDSIPNPFNQVDLVINVNPVGSSVNITLSALENNNWGEYDLIWSNKPTLAEVPLITETISSSNTSETYRFDVSSYVQTKLQNSEYEFSFVFQALVAVSSPVSISTLENGAAFPYLDFNFYNSQKIYTDNQWIIFPNPAGSFINIEGLTKNLEIDAIEILNIQGQVIITKSIESVLVGMINTEELTSGVYFLKIHSKQNSCLYRFVKL
ncbi:MAG: DNRLRE domain-containing protein [Bacteroidales bacterium]|nr:DNRLRE domain-containing protein [Bacteroidales bacterium]MCF8391917.1 DNRLRE domain-containing protein [Bacteroidales bacterium]